MKIMAKYASVCGSCGKSIRVGDSIEWSRGERPRHTDCSVIPTVSSAERVTVTRPTSRRAAPGKWTGCACGSRVDSYGQLLPGPACWTCRHDNE